MGERRQEPSDSPTSSWPSTVISRGLTRRELDVLAWMINYAKPLEPSDSGDDVREVDRARWRTRLVDTRAGRRCDCGSCPSIELTFGTGVRAVGTRSRVVLAGHTDEAMVLLFIDDDQLSYLELAPTGDRSFTTFLVPANICAT